MRRLRTILALLFLGPLTAFAQTREETVEFIVSEFKSFEKRERIYNEIQFSPQGDSFRLVRSTKKRNKAGVAFKLREVDIFLEVHNRANGVNNYKLVARPRGRDVNVLVNGQKTLGAAAITPFTHNAGKALALERAFTWLTQLTTDRKFPFSDPAR